MKLLPLLLSYHYQLILILLNRNYSVTHQLYRFLQSANESHTYQQHHRKPEQPNDQSSFLVLLHNHQSCCCMNCQSLQSYYPLRLHLSNRHLRLIGLSECRFRFSFWLFQLSYTFLLLLLDVYLLQ